MSCAGTSTKKYNIELLNTIKHNDETFSFDFKSQDGLRWNEGDSSKLYMSLGRETLGKKFSFATLPMESVIRFTTRVKSERSDYKDVLSKLVTGDFVEISEPSGDFKLKRDNRPIVLLSNGVGIAASRSLIMAYDRNNSSIPELKQINVDAKGKIYFDEFENLSKRNPKFKSYYETHRENYYKRLDHEIQLTLQDNALDPYVYVVGGASFVNASIAHLKSVGFSEDDIMTDGHVSTEGSCGCSSGGGCGCGSNLITFNTENKYLLPVIGKKAS